MAMEAWALAELERGPEPDDLIQRIVAGNSCIAVLGVAVTIAIKSEAMSEGVLALASSQRLLSADHQRWRHDAVDKTSSLIGFDKTEDLPHAQAVKSADRRRSTQRLR